MSTIKISNLTSVGAVQGNVMLPLVSNVAGTLTTLKGNVDQIGDYLLSSLRANVITQQADIYLSNVTLKSYVDGQITAANAGIVTANVGMIGYVTSAVSTANVGVVGYVDQANTAMKGYVDSVATLSIYGNSNVQSYLTTISGNVVPSADVLYDLGSSTRRWKDLWISGSTIHLGNANITANGTSITANLISSNISTTSLTVTDNISANTINLGGAELSVSGGAIQSSLPIAADVTATNITVQGTRIEFASGGYIEEAEIVDANAAPTGFYIVAINSSDDGIVGLNALDSNAAVTSSLFVANTAVQINVANSAPSGNALVWLFDQGGSVVWPDATVQTSAYTDSYTMGNLTHWTSNVYTIQDALDQLAERIYNIENP